MTIKKTLEQPELDSLISQTLVTGEEPPEPEPDPVQVAGGRFGFRGTNSATKIREGVEQGNIPASKMEEAAEILVPPGGSVDPGRPSARDPSLRNINFQRIETTDDVLRTIDTISEQGDHFVVDRRGVRTIDQAKADAAEIELEALLGRSIGEAFNDSQVIGLRTALVESAERLQNASKIILEGNASEADMLAFRQMVAQHAAIQAQAAGAAAEAGRALNAFKVTANSGMLQAAQVRHAMESAGGRASTVKLAGLINDAADPAAVAAATRNNWHARGPDMILEYWINGLLSSPATHAVNTGSNAAVALWMIPERLLASGISKVLRSENGVRVGEAVGQLYGIVQGTRDGLKLAWHALKTGEPTDALQKYEARKYRAITADNIAEILGKKGRAVGLDPTAVANGGVVAQGVDLLGEAVRLPGRFLGAEDEFFKAVGYRMELHALAYHQAAKEGLTGRDAAARITDIINNPPESLHMEAIQAGRVQTFTNDLGEFGRGVQRLANSQPAAKLLLPFVRTPVNIVKFVGMRSPMAPFAKSFRADIRAGGARRDLALARMAMGSLIMMVGGEMASRGVITGKLSENPGVRSAQMRKGIQPYSIRFGDKLYSFNRGDPLGMFLGLSADVVEVMKYADDEDANEVAAAAVVALAQNLTSRTYMRGLSEFITAMDDPERYMERYLQRQAATFVPYTSLVAQAERTMDPTLRATYSVMDQIRSRTPGLSDELPPRRNLWGNPIVLEGGFGWDFVSPIYTSTEIESLADQEIIDNEVNIRMPRNVLGQGEFAVELLPKEYDRYVELAGRDVKVDGLGLKDYLELKLIPGRLYQNATPGPDGMRAVLIRKTVNAFRDAAKLQLQEEKPWLKQALEYEKRRQLEALGKR